MSSKIYSATTLGMEGKIIEIEVDTSPGQPVFSIVGLPDAAIKESKDRVCSAIKNSGFRPPHFFGRITVNLAPADLKKEGPAFDLPIALGILEATGQIEQLPNDTIFLGELALDGRLRPIKGALPISIAVVEKNFFRIALPQENSKEANLVAKTEILAVQNLQQIVDHLKKNNLLSPVEKEELIKPKTNLSSSFDFCFIKGQQQAKRALEIAVAGGHNVLMSGPPGSGKTMLAKSVPSIMPEMNTKEIFEVTRVYSIAGLTGKENPLIFDRPFRSPHHSASAVSLVGGGSFPRPGEISLANRGVLFLDEFPEFSREVIENLRQPLEDGNVCISRAQGTLSFPARFILIAAMNPCPCGNHADPEKPCICTLNQVTRYKQKISGPILDRIDIHINVPRIKFEKLSSEKLAENSEEVRKRIEGTRKTQEKRFLETSLLTNSEMQTAQIRTFCQVDEESKKLLQTAVHKMSLSPRAYHRILKVSRTIADLDGSERIKSHHLAEAIQYRFKED